MIRKRKTVFTIGLLALIVVALALYTAIVPAFISYQYINKVRMTARPLEANFKELGESTELPIILDPTATQETKKDNAAHISQLIISSRQNIALLKSANNSLVPLPYSDFLGNFGEAKVFYDRTGRFIKQSEDTLDDYEKLVAYLMTFNKTTDSVMTELNGFNDVADLDVYIGQTEKVKQTASKIRADADLLLKTSSPHDTVRMNEAAIATFNQAAGGFDDLASGLTIVSDEPIYAAARKIEGATSELERITTTMHDESLTSSRTIKNVQDLNEKLELVSGV